MVVVETGYMLGKGDADFVKDGFRHGPPFQLDRVVCDLDDVNFLAGCLLASERKGVDGVEVGVSG